MGIPGLEKRDRLEPSDPEGRANVVRGSADLKPSPNTSNELFTIRGPNPKRNNRQN